MSTAKSKIIVIEPDVRALKDLEAKLSPSYAIVGSFQADRAMTLLRAEPDAKAIIVSTSKGGDVLGLLNAVRHEFPQVLRLLLTAFEDLTQIVEGLHSGAVHRIVSKPLQFNELLSAVPTGEQYGSTSSHVHHA